MAHVLSFASGFGVSAGLIVAIGAQNIFVLQQGLRREHVGPIVAFCAASDILLISAGVAGLGALLQHVPRLTLILTLAGVIFLCGYGVDALRRALKPGAAVAVSGRGALSLGGALARAGAFTLLNPHVYLDTVMLMGALGASQPNADRPLFIAGAGLASGTWFCALGFGARWLTPVFARPHAWRILDGVVALIMLGLAAGLSWRLLAGAGL